MSASRWNNTGSKIAGKARSSASFAGMMASAAPTGPAVCRQSVLRTDGRRLRREIRLCRHAVAALDLKAARPQGRGKPPPRLESGAEPAGRRPQHRLLGRCRAGFPEQARHNHRHPLFMPHPAQLTSTTMARSQASVW